MIRQLLAERDIEDYRIIDPARIPVEQWVRFRCMFGCPNYGKMGTCPPAVPSVAECRELIAGYQKAILFHVRLTVDDMYRDRLVAFDRKLLDLERAAFLAGYYKAFLLVCSDCSGCKTCTAHGCRVDCKNKSFARPSMEAVGIDVYQTARNAGYKIDVVNGNGETNRFALLLLE